MIDKMTLKIAKQEVAYQINRLIDDSSYQIDSYKSLAERDTDKDIDKAYYRQQRDMELKKREAFQIIKDLLEA